MVPLDDAGACFAAPASESLDRQGVAEDAQVDLPGSCSPRRGAAALWSPPRPQKPKASWSRHRYCGWRRILRSRARARRARAKRSPRRPRDHAEAQSDSAADAQAGSAPAEHALPEGKPRVYHAIALTPGSDRTEQLDDAEVFVTPPLSARRSVELELLQASRRKSMPYDCHLLLDSGLEGAGAEGLPDACEQLRAGVMRRASEQIMMAQLKQFAAKQKLRYSPGSQRERIIAEAVRFTELYCRTISILETCLTLRPPLRRHSDCFVADVEATWVA